MSPPAKKHKVDKSDVLEKIAVLQNDVTDVKDAIIRMEKEESSFRKCILETITNQHTVTNNNLAENNVSLKSIIQSFWKTPKFAKVFPITSDEDLQKWDEDINENNKDEMVKTVTTVLGEKGLIKGLPFIIAQNVLLNYNVDGVHNKTSFKSFTNVYEVLFLSYTAMSINSKEPKSFDTVIRLAFKQAKNRYFKDKCVKNKQKNANQEKASNESGINLNDAISVDAESSHINVQNQPTQKDTEKNKENNNNTSVCEEIQVD